MQLNRVLERGENCQLILLADHNDVSSSLQMLKNEGYMVDYFDCERFQLEMLELQQPAAVLIDLEKPSVEKISICKHLRSCYMGPILVLSVKSNEVVQVLGLEMGADDFLFKPQPETLLLAKLRAHLRRAETSGHFQRKTVQLGELVIDSSRREVWCSGVSVSLTAREFDLLWCLAENAKSILSRDQIHQLLYNSEYNGYDRAIDIYISRIRQKLGDDPLNPRYLKTVRGAGYLLVEGHSS